MATKTSWKDWFSNLGTKAKDSGAGKAMSDLWSGDSIWEKLVFLVLVVIVFILALRAGTSLLTWLFSPNPSPHLTRGMKDAKKLLVIPQNPKVAHSIPVMRSSNQRGGLEFTWTVWIYVDDWVYKEGQRRHIFHKGSKGMNPDGTAMAFPNNGPGLYMHPTRNSLIIVMNTFKNIVEEVEVNDIPTHKWLNVGIRQKARVMDVFINGDVVLRHVFNSVPKQNYGDVFVNMNGGFSGKLSDLWYHDYALSGTQIMQIVRDGPDMSTMERKWAVPPYFSLQWYFENANAPYQGAPRWPTDA